jgi:putative inorganic carbon (HCO3(-)) transporter
MSQPLEHFLDARAPDGMAIEYGIVILCALTVALVAFAPESLMVVVFVLLVIIAAVEFDWFAYSLIFLLPWYPLPDFELPMRDIFLFFHVSMFIAVGMLRWRDHKPLGEWIIGGRIRKGILLFAFIATISLLTAGSRANLDAYRSLLRLYSYIAFFYAVIGWMDTRDKVYGVIKTLLVSTVLVAVFGFYQSMQGSYTDFYFHLYPLQERSALEDWNGRITSFLFHFNSLAGYLNLVIPFAIGYTLLAKRRSRLMLGMTCLCTASAALYLTGSRGGLVAFAGIAFSSVVFVLLYFRPSGAKLFRGLLAIILAGVIVLLLTPRQSEQSSRLQEVDDFTEITRLALWATAASVFVEHPLLGAGYGTFRSLYDDYLPQIEGGQLDAHNIYLQLLAETGVLGFFAFLALMVAFLRSSLQLVKQVDPFYRIAGVGLCGAIIGVLIHGLVDFLFHVSPQFGGLFWMVLGIGLVVSEEARRSAEFRSKPVSA